jgi:hypothetical protein
MADRYPLIANSESGQIQEIQPGDNLNLTDNGIVGATTVTANQFKGDLAGTASTAISLQSANNIISGTVSADRLAGFYNVSVSSAEALTNADNITGGTVPRARLDGTYDANITGIAETANSLSDAARITDGIIPAARLTGAYDIDITGTAFASVGAAVSISAQENPDDVDVQYLTFVKFTGTDTSIFTDSVDLTYIPDSSSFGIGTALPRWNLHVEGDAYISGNLGISSISVDDITPTLISNLGGIDNNTRETLLTALDISNLNSLNVSGFSTFTDLYSSGQADFTNVAVAGTAIFNTVIFQDSAGSIVAPSIETEFLNVTGIGTFAAIGVGTETIVGVGTTGDIQLRNIGTIDDFTKDTLQDALGIQFFENLNTNGIGTLIGRVDVTNGINVSAGSTVEDLIVTGVATFSNIDFSALDGATFNDLNVTGVVTAAQFVGGGEFLSGIVTTIVAGIGVTLSPTNGKGQVTISAFKPVGKTIYVSQGGDDTNSGLSESDTKRTVKSASLIAEEGDTIKVFPGVYVENNPIILKKRVAVEGAELRNCIISPLNPGEDLFYVNNACHITDLSFQGQEAQNGAAVIAFQPLLGVADNRFFDAARLMRNNIDFIAHETVGYLTSTDYRDPPFQVLDGQGNPDDPQNCRDDIKDVLKAIMHDITRGGNSKCVGAGLSYYSGDALQHIVGVKTETMDAFTYAAGVCRSIVNNSHWAGKSDGAATPVIQAYYDGPTGMTTITSLGHGLQTGDIVTLSGLGFTCSTGVGTYYYPSGNYGYTFEVLGVGNTNQFEVNTGPSTIPHTYASGGEVQKRVNYQSEYTQVRDLSIQPDPSTGMNNHPSGCTNVVSAIYSCIGGINLIIDQGPSVLGVGINTTYPGNNGLGSNDPNDPSFSPGVGPITQGPYIRNCTNFIPKSIGMRVNGFDAEPGDKDDIGVTGSMSVDSYTQYNQGGIGVSITNGAYAQLVSIFTICTDIAIYTSSGGQCDLTNSNSSFGTFGLVSEGVGGPLSKSIYRYTGEVNAEAARGQNIIEISGVGTQRPYDGQALYFDTLYEIVETIEVTDGGSGYTSPPRITIDAPSGPNGITAQATATVENGSITEITVVTNGTQYIGAPNVVIAGPSGAGTTATASVTAMEPIYYTVLEATKPVSGLSTVSLAQNLNNTVSAGSTAFLSRLSLQLTSSHAFEFIGAGNDINGARPAQGGVTIQENEVVQNNGGTVVFTSTDQAGNFRIGDGIIINQATGSITGRDFTKALFTTMTPFILALTD